MLRRILSGEAAQRVERERRLLARVGELARELEPDGPGAARMEELASQLDGMFLLVVVGEVKAGKSAFLNALLGEEVCPEGPLPLTDRIHLLAYGAERAETVLEPHVVRRTLPLEVLRKLNVVDTPGTNSPVGRHQEITESFLPRADIVFFVTSIDRPLPRSELELLQQIRERWDKALACVLAKVDLQADGDRAAVVGYVRETLRSHLGFEPPLFAVSAHRARAGRREGSEERVRASGLPEVERWMVEQLTDGHRLRLKLRSPLGAALDLLRSLAGRAKGRRRVLEEDFAGWRALVEQVEFFRTAAPERAERRLAKISAAFDELEVRGRRYLGAALRWRNLRLLASSERFQAGFEREVVQGTASQVERAAEDLTRWLAEQTRSLWERALEHFRSAEVLDKYRAEILGGADPGFEQTRRETLAAIRDRVRAHLEGWSLEGESKRIRALAARGMERALGAEIAAGLGGALAAVLMPAAAAGVGLVLAVAVAVGGLLILPRRRERAILGFSDGVRGTRDGVLASLREAVEAEASRAAEGALEAFAPFRDFYEARRGALVAAGEEAADLRREIELLRAEIG